VKVVLPLRDIDEVVLIFLLFFNLCMPTPTCLGLKGLVVVVFNLCIFLVLQMLMTYFFLMNIADKEKPACSY
jgi:hypothetical protein